MAPLKHLTNASLLSLALVTAATASDCSFQTITASKDLTWCSCADNALCAKLDVPLDYQDTGLGRASIPLYKIPAQSNSSDGAYQGMILINPGGPGASGVLEAQFNGTTIQGLIGSNWDIVGFDTRGTWLSEPLANCSAGVAGAQRRSVPRLTDQFYQDYVNFAQNVGKKCQSQTGDSKDAGPHMSTAVIARDMLSIVDAFNKSDDGRRAAKPSSRLNYYGISYGTFLGQTFASMFSDRVGNMVLDGNVSPEAYLANNTGNAVNHLDGVLAMFFVYCNAAGSKDCSYYTGSTPKDIFQRFNHSFTQLDPRTAQDKHWTNATDLESAALALKVGLLTAADSPISFFPQLSKALLDLENALANNTLKDWTDQFTNVIGDPTPAGFVNSEWNAGTLCSDQGNRWNGKQLADLQPLIQQLQSQSIIGEVWIHSELSCTGWGIKAKEVYDGPFGGKTATPILFVGNTYDPVTPIDNAVYSAPRYDEAQVLTVDGMGHTSGQTSNKCAFSKLKAYYQQTQMPGKDAYCPLEAGPFGVTLNGSLKDNIACAGLTTLQSDSFNKSSSGTHDSSAPRNIPSASLGALMILCYIYFSSV